MNNKRISFKLYARTDKMTKQNLIPIYGRILADKKIEIATSIYIREGEWNEKNQRLNNNAQNADTQNSFLDSFHSKVLDAYTKLFIEGGTITAELIKERIFGKVQSVKTIIDVVTEHNEMFEKRIGIDYSYGSFKNYKTTKKYLAEFVQTKYKKKDLPITEINYSFCEHYYNYLVHEKPCNNNGANKHIQRLKKLVNYAYKMGYVSSNALMSYSLKFNRFVQQKLTWDDIVKLQSLQLHNQTLERIRDVFLFQCFTGLAYADVKKLSHEHITVEGQQNWIQMERTKTKTSFSIPILKPAQDILNKYSNLPSNRGDTMFPVLSNQKMNAGLKIIAEIAGVKKNISSHVARHTFATTVTLQSGVPLETVSKMLGHTKISTTQMYSVVTQIKVSKDMETIIKKFDNG
jgi:site-specific recombinase XerD